jgi:hypothetical protein
MSLTPYKYEAHFKWKWHGVANAWDIPNKDDYETKLAADFRSALSAELAEKMALANHAFKLDGVQTNFTSGSSSFEYGFPLGHWNVDFAGETIIAFESDVQDPLAHKSPQLMQILTDGFEQLLAWLGDHPQIVATVLILGALTILAIWLINTATGAITTLGSTPGAFIITVGVLGLIGLVVVAVAFTGFGRKAATKAYRGARRITA